jgi:hypothetical protein
MKRLFVVAVSSMLVCQGVSECSAVPTIWTGPKITFSKAALADASLPKNQDRLTDNVWLTRGSGEGVYNAKTEASYIRFSSPTDTEWSFGTTAVIGSLTFEAWRDAVNGSPPTSVGQDMVLHLITDDIFVDIKFLSWGQHPQSGGFFSYERSTPVPEPATVGMALLGLAIVGSVRRRCQIRSS